MKIMSATILSLLITGAQALASANNGGNGDGLGFMATLFIGFGVLIILFQTIPTIMLLTGMLKGLFSSADKKPSEANTGSSGNNY